MSKEKRLFDDFRKYVPSSKAVVKEGISLTLARHGSDSEYIRNNFSILVRECEVTAYAVYLDYEKNAWMKGLDDYLFLGRDMGAQVQRAEFLYDNFEQLNSFFTSLSNSRKARGGGAFQYIIKDLLSRLDYPFVEEATINGKPDFLFPSVKHYENNPVDCIILTVKRIIRERWRQIVTEGSRGLGFFLATIDVGVSENQLHEMAANHIYLVVPESIKNNTKQYKKSLNVISFETFFEDYLNPAMKRWKKTSIKNT